MNIAIEIDHLRREMLPAVRTASAFPKRVVVSYGFRIFLLSDIVMFAALVAAYAVLVGAIAGGASAVMLFDQRNMAIATACLLASSVTCALMSLTLDSRRRAGVYLAALVTFALGVAFLGLEIREFADMIARGATPQSSPFLSAFFALVGCHALQVTVGLVWLVSMIAQVAIMGIRPTVERRVLCFALFWHALDIIWVCLFASIYLMGARP